MNYFKYFNNFLARIISFLYKHYMVHISFLTFKSIRRRLLVPISHTTVGTVLRLRRLNIFINYFVEASFDSCRKQTKHSYVPSWLHHYLPRVVLKRDYLLSSYFLRMYQLSPFYPSALFNYFLQLVIWRLLASVKPCQTSSPGKSSNIHFIYLPHLLTKALANLGLRLESQTYPATISLICGSCS